MDSEAFSFNEATYGTHDRRRKILNHKKKYPRKKNPAEVQTYYITSKELQQSIYPNSLGVSSNNKEIRFKLRRFPTMRRIRISLYTYSDMEVVGLRFNRKKKERKKEAEKLRYIRNSHKIRLPNHQTQTTMNSKTHSLIY